METSDDPSTIPSPNCPHCGAVTSLVSSFVDPVLAEESGCLGASAESKYMHPSLSPTNRSSNA
jgi:hypothetical protein